MRLTCSLCALLAATGCAQGSGQPPTHRAGAGDAGVSTVRPDASWPADDGSETPAPVVADAGCAAECTAGEVEERAESCGVCGEGERRARRTCTDACTWGAYEPVGGCVTAATCFPAETDVETRDCTSGCGGVQTRTRPCGPACTWGAWSAWSACATTCCGDGVCGSGESCASCEDCRAGHLGTGDNGDPCPAWASETWRCVTITRFGTRGSQVCRGGSWITFHLDPRACSSCSCAFSSSCCAASGC